MNPVLKVVVQVLLLTLLMTAWQVPGLKEPRFWLGLIALAVYVGTV